MNKIELYSVVSSRGSYDDYHEYHESIIYTTKEAADKKVQEIFPEFLPWETNVCKTTFLFFMSITHILSLVDEKLKSIIVKVEFCTFPWLSNVLYIRFRCSCKIQKKYWNKKTNKFKTS